MLILIFWLFFRLIYNLCIFNSNRSSYIRMVPNLFIFD